MTTVKILGAIVLFIAMGIGIFFSMAVENREGEFPLITKWAHRLLGFSGVIATIAIMVMEW